MKNFFIAVVLAALPSLSVAADEPVVKARQHALPAARSGGTVIGLCDGKTTIEVRDLKSGQTMSREQAQSVSDELMAAWRKAHPEAHWDGALAQNGPTQLAQNAPTERVQPTAGPNQHGATAAHSGGAPAAGAAAQGEAGAPMGAHVQAGTYESYTNRDELVWAAETQKFIDEGSKIFHDAGKLGGTIGVSCDMCHPNAANTHAETYPKFQVQLGRVALLRDMINWCLENPVKGKPLRDGDDRLRALEAYITAQRKGVPLEYGKH